MIPPDDMGAQLRFVLSALAGGAFYGLYHLAAVLLAGTPPTHRDVLRAIGNVICAIIAGGLFAAYAGAAVLDGANLPFLDSNPSALGFGIGALTWELVPIAYIGVKKAANAFASRFNK
ncbi:hypothetical protein UFOVP1288_47 [uncultured Caudovirales phage]|uniref:Uncharacterized protein n=1 Tax=uncultured Caudovirales phage TaxID=2100421 RepID=A0A6J5R783_9CAUD|nr:hypothetical protein UFOVP1195_47 [uncultured Caudovirales phage]CAB4195908.1 hypothetical protein UFOVP1288_47 [uncultured Caudovirales phage]CAB4205071.1 hypothetical protein UFOVP1409_47 [uncultured Caudovirales phage]